MSDTSGTNLTDASVFNTGTTGIDTTGLGGLSSLLSGAGGASIGSPFDFSGSVFDASSGQAFSPWDPSTYAAGMYSGADQYGQTAQQIQSSDPGSQLQGAQTGPTQQGTQTGQQTAAGQPQAMQPTPGSYLAAVNQMGRNPYAIGGGGGVPSVPAQGLTSLMRQAAPAAAPAAVAVPAQPPPAAAPAAAPGPAAGPPAATTGTGRGAAPSGPETGTPDPGSEADPAQQAAARQAQAAAPPQVQQILQNFLRSPIGQLIDQFTNGGLSQLLNQQQGLASIQQQYGNQVPRGYTAQNMPRWVTPEQYQQYQRTGQMPSQTGTVGQGGGQRGQGAPTQPTSVPLTSADPNAFRAGTGPVGGMYRGNAPGASDLTGTVDQSQIPQPSPDVQRAIAQADAAPFPTNTIQGQQANIMATGGPGYTDMQGQRRRGMSPNAIAGVFANIRDESGFNPNLRHPDQPNYSGEARYAHGLYQEGGPDWPLFQQFLNGRDWRNPRLQTEFMMQHFAQRNPRAWNAMNNAQSPGHAAQIFVQSYLIPARNYMVQRSIRYGRGVPSVNQQLAQNRQPGLTMSSDESGDESGYLSKEEEADLSLRAPQNIQVSPDASPRVRGLARAINEGGGSVSNLLNRQYDPNAPADFYDRFGRWQTKYYGDAPMYTKPVPGEFPEKD